MHKRIRFLLKNIQQICGRYDMNENELILSVTIDNDKKWCMKYGDTEKMLTPYMTPCIM